MGPRPRTAARHRSARPERVRPRYGRIVSATGSVTVTAVALLAAGGMLPVGAGPELAPGADIVAAAEVPARDGLSLSAFDAPARLWRGEPPGGQRPAPPGSGTSGSGAEVAGSPEPAPEARDPEALPPRSGRGKRVVFDIGDQRVWLVGEDGEVRRTYLVSGSLTDNLKPGTYEVYSTSRHAVGIDDSGTMQYMVRFAHGTRAAIGFHDIPVDDGKPLQTRAELGTPQSHGCIRQARPDARALWYFAIVGTKVVVTA